MALNVTESPCDGYGNPATSKKTVYDVITSRIIESLEGGEVPWRKPWKGGKGGTPRNAITGWEYRGINLISTALQSFYDRQEWITFKQVSKIPGAMIRKGESATPIIYWLVKDVERDGKKETIFSPRYYRVWNVAQVDGLDQWESARKKHEEENPERPVSPIQAAENVIAGFRNPPPVSHGFNHACYIPSKDAIEMPAMKQFETDAEYYSTLFHELTHSTGHSSRLGREGILDAHRFGDAVYSKEELVAEMGAAFLCGTTGIEAATVKNSAAYIQSWLKKLRGDSKLVVQAAQRAQKAADYILGVKLPRKGDADADA
jgi:antirestriction protein ArdC